MAAEIAKCLAKESNANVTVLNVNRIGERSLNSVKRRPKPVFKQLNGQNLELKIINGNDVVKAIQKEADKYDVIILGATEEGLFQQLLFGTISERVAANCNKTVILTKRDMGLRSSKKVVGEKGYLKRKIVIEKGGSKTAPFLFLSFQALIFYYFFCLPFFQRFHGYTSKTVEYRN